MLAILVVAAAAYLYVKFVRPRRKAPRPGETS